MISAFVKIALTLRYLFSKKIFILLFFNLTIVLFTLLGLALDRIRMTGTTSWYGQKFYGRKTASGEIYDQWAFTAAHRYLKFGTLVSVKNLQNNKKVTVRINDRGPYWPGRIIDLSLGAAEKIDMRQQGLARVRLKIIYP